MTLRTLLSAALLLAVPLAGCMGGPGDDGGTTPACPEAGLPAAHQDLADDGTLHAYMNTSKGDVVVELYHERAPVTVANFVRYTLDGFYDDTVFHRVVESFVVQGGGFTQENGSLEKKETREPIPLERHPDLRNRQWTLSMARTQNPNSATSQFFINLERNTDSLDSGAGYAVFGKVVAGTENVDAMETVETTEKDGRSNVPVDPIRLRCVSLDLPADDEGVTVAPVHDEVTPATGDGTQVAFQVRNAWDAVRDVEVTATQDATGLEVPTSPTSNMTLPPGATALVLVDAPADVNATAGLEVRGPSTGDTATTAVRPADGTGPAADKENHTRVDVRYVGLQATGVPFDTNDPDIDEREGLRILPDQGGQRSVLEVWTGEDKDPDGEYTRVIPGFRDALLGLRQGQTALEYVPPDQGYQDGVDRWFSVDVVDVRPR